MSDYGMDTFGPLFEQAKPSVVARKSNGEFARKYHERVSAQAEALQRLRCREEMTDVRWKELHPGSRLAPTIDKLRNAHGFHIDGDGKTVSPYTMKDTLQMPALVAVTHDIKEAYYASTHWADTRERRFEHDGHRCVLCRSHSIHTAHHMFYDLFNEAMPHLITVCADCHDTCHSQSKLAFPSGIRAEHAVRLGFDVKFDEWLLPEGAMACRS